MTWDTIEDAFLFVSSETVGMNMALVCLDSGEAYYQSVMGTLDEVNALEECEDFDMDRYVRIPHKNDLDLGKDLVFEFVHQYLPNESDRVYGMFHRRGAYSSFKSFLESRKLLQQWYDFEDARREQALRQWCRKHGIELTD